MTREEIKKLVDQYGFEGEFIDRARLLAEEVERQTRGEFFSLIQCANNAANSRDLTARELDKLVWDLSVKKANDKNSERPA